MTPTELSNSIDQIISEANGLFIDGLGTINEEIYSSILRILKDLELDSEGYIKQNASNRRILNLAQGEFDTAISNSNYQRNLERYLNSIPSIDELNAAYFETISAVFKPNRIFIQQLQSGTINSINQLLLQDGLAAQVKIPIGEILNQNINSGGQFSGLLQQLRDFITGRNDLDARLTSYSRGILRDALFQYSRSYQEAITADLGLNFYVYLGGLTKDSRPFCTQRAGKYFGRKEVQSWAGLSWAGKNKYTTESSIFIVCGGYNCNHQLIPVDISTVPKDVIDRNA